MRQVIYQEANPARARTYRSIAEARRDATYAAAIQRGPARRVRFIERLCWIASILLLVAIVTAPHWWPK